MAGSKLYTATSSHNKTSICCPSNDGRVNFPDSALSLWVRYAAAGRAVAARRSMPCFIFHVVTIVASVAQITT